MKQESVYKESNVSSNQERAVGEPLSKEQVLRFINQITELMRTNVDECIGMIMKDSRGKDASSDFVFINVLLYSLHKMMVNDTAIKGVTFVGLAGLELGKHEYYGISNTSGRNGIALDLVFDFLQDKEERLFHILPLILEKVISR